MSRPGLVLTLFVVAMWALAYRRYSARYIAQEERAKDAQAGLWAGESVPPWEWRRDARLEQEVSDAR